MKKLKRALPLFTFLLLHLFFIPSLVFAEYVTNQWETLRDVESFNVTVLFLDPPVGKLRFTEKTLWKDVEMTFRKADIHVLPKGSMGDPLFIVYVNFIYIEKIHAYVYNLQINVMQTVHMETKPDLSFPSSTWQNTITGIVPEGKIEGKVRRDLRKILDVFLQDYRLVNPKKRID